MAKQSITQFLLILLMSLIGVKTFAQGWSHFSAKNADGKLIYYWYIKDGMELSVARGPGGNYSGNIVIPEEVTYNNKTLKVTSIGYEAFYDCYNVTSVSIPNSVTIIEDEAFYGCSGLTSLIIPNSVTTICHDAFKRCSGLTSVVIGDNVKFIPQGAFYGCGSLTSLTIPNCVTSIGMSAFYGCYSMNSVTIGNGVSLIDFDAFFGCTGLTSVHISDLASWCNIDFIYNLDNMPADYYSNTNPLQYAHHLYLNGEEIKHLIIPDNVTSIADAAFSGCSSLTSVTIPNSVTSIGRLAFQGCDALISIVVPNSVTSIGDNAFEGCSCLDSITIPDSVITIGNSSFKDCNSLNSVTFGNNLTEIGHYAFSGCSSLTSVIIPNSLLSIGGSAFEDCKKLTSVTIGNSLTSIGSYAFSECRSLNSINFPNSLTSIGNNSFWYCTKLSSITIPNSVTVIGDFAFYGCTGLKSIVSLIENPFEIVGKSKKYGLGTFSNTTFNYTQLYIPKGTIDKYMTTEGWKDFRNIEEIMCYKLSYVLDGEEIITITIPYGYNITPEPNPSKEGYTFSGWSEIPETMPDHDVTVTGSFTINKYKLTYLVDGEEYKTYDVEYNSTITAETAPTKEGYTFSGWSETPETMPANDVTVTGSFTINKYKLTYIVDGEEYKSIEVEYNSPITPEADPTKDGYNFSGWSEIPETMPAHDVTITGSFERRYDVGNVTSLISFILRGNGGNDDLAIYDMNRNGVLDVGDLILIVRKVLNSTKRSAITRADMNYHVPDLTQYSAAQFVLNVPENVREQDICLVEGIKQTHQMMCKQIESGGYAVVVYSLTNSLFMPENGNIVEVNAGKNHSDDLSIQDVILAKPTGETMPYGYMPVRTYISDVEIENDHRHVYNLKGQKQNRVNGMLKGVYIEDGKTIVIR